MKTRADARSSSHLKRKIESHFKQKICPNKLINLALKNKSKNNKLNVNKAKNNDKQHLIKKGGSTVKKNNNNNNIINHQQHITAHNHNHNNHHNDNEIKTTPTKTTTIKISTTVVPKKETKVNHKNGKKELNSNHINIFKNKIKKHIIDNNNKVGNHIIKQEKHETDKKVNDINRKSPRRIDIDYVKNAPEFSRPNTPSSVSFRDYVSESPSPSKTCLVLNNHRKSSQSPKSNHKSSKTKPKNSPNIKTPSTQPKFKSEKIEGEKSLLNKLIDIRRREINHIILQNNSPQKKIDSDTTREQQLKHLTPLFDYEMFKAAQAKAADQLQQRSKDGSKSKSGIKSIQLGRYEIDVWYGSPYPEEYRYLSKLYICEFCLKYMTSGAVSSRHNQKCILRHPPGNEIYRKGNISFFEVDGQQNEIYCQNLCLLAKLFLDHKTLYFDVAPFLFYVMAEYDDDGFHILGYFSKEKNSFLNYNVSCILTLPPYQKQGYGKLLIDLSYLLTRLENKVGSPEKPLSDMGLISYRSYWKLIILEYLCNYQAKEICIKDIAQETGVNANDLISTLQAMGMLKYWKGKHLILTRQDILDEYRVNRRKKDSFKRVDPNCLRWKPVKFS